MFINISYLQDQYDDWDDQHHYLFSVQDSLFSGGRVELSLVGGRYHGSERFMLAGALVKFYNSNKLNVPKNLARFYLIQTWKDARNMNEYISNDMATLDRIFHPSYSKLVPCIQNQIKMLQFCNRYVGKPKKKPAVEPAVTHTGMLDFLIAAPRRARVGSAPSFRFT